MAVKNEHICRHVGADDGIDSLDGLFDGGDVIVGGARHEGLKLDVFWDLGRITS
jgi:hypothetical protein